MWTFARVQTLIGFSQRESVVFYFFICECWNKNLNLNKFNSVNKRKKEGKEMSTHKKKKGISKRNGVNWRNT